MPNLPVEVLQLIFNLLVQRDKLECMTVCRQWQYLIHQHCLFNVVYVDCLQKLNNLIQIVKRDPIQGTKVERLIVKADLGKDFDQTIFVQLFPNVREFTLSYGLSNVIQQPQSHPWRQYIEKVEERCSAPHTKTLLHSGLCNKLTYISVSGSALESSKNFIEALANAPALKILHLNFFSISFPQLELLHKTAPLLESLLLENLNFYNDPLPSNIKPATSMISFRCTSCDFDGDDPNPHVQYISKKYPHLEELTLELDHLIPIYMHEEDGDEEEIEQEPEPEEVLIPRYRAILASCMKTLGPRLKQLTLKSDGFDGDDVSGGFSFDLLDNYGCQLEKLELTESLYNSSLDDLANTAQSQSIKSLSLTVFDSSDKLIKLEWLRRYSVLKELTISSYIISIAPQRHILDLSTLLNVLSEKQLETLCLRDLHVKFDESSINQVYPSLKELTFYNVTFQPDTDIFLSRVFPNLKRLKLASHFGNRETLMFPNTDLSYLEIINLNENNDFPVMVITRNDQQPRLYTTTPRYHPYTYKEEYAKKDVFVLPSVSSEPLDQSLRAPMLTVVCKSLNDFMMMICKRV